MKKKLMNLGILLGWTALALSTSSCSRSRGEVWEDTKTCKRYLGKGVRSLFGQHVDSRDYANFYEKWEDDGSLCMQDPLSSSKSSEFIPLADSAPTSMLSIKDYPISRESPGDPGSPIPGIDKFAYPTGVLAELFNNIHFDTDSYTIQGSENIATLRKIADHLGAHPHLYVFVEGHADERGAAAYNLALGARRSNAVRNFLIQNGVDSDRLFTISYGLERPLVQGHDESCWKQNRRAQFRLYDR